MQKHWQIGRFGLAGIVNTVVGYGVILLCLSIGIGDYLANAIGYGTGFLLSFALNRRFTFGLRGPVQKGEVARFAVALMLAYAANLAVLTVGRAFFGEGYALVQLPALATYTAVFYVLSVRLVFVHRQGA
ncbi:GtrA family protein [Qipengyuania sp. G39]|uniref:GtrA family protein n=1 Tax=Qipengyuania profundimaris TaxID=3067652 RepID=A0ABT9HRN3_9SPHN|nr:GtrA family protein [Qipengyuania sp. G39]MDP4575804.1 GtrA family protein [Qipengyuania sp. G39]